MSLADEILNLQEGSEEPLRRVRRSELLGLGGKRLSLDELEAEDDLGLEDE